MEIDAEEASNEPHALLPEIDVYLHLLVMIYLLDKQELEKVGCLVWFIVHADHR
jgi:hypothetical protein